MDYKMLKISKKNMVSVGIDNVTGLYYLCVLTGFADVPEYHPITNAEYKNFDTIEYQTLLFITNRCITEIGENKYKFQWTSKYNPIYAIIRKNINDFWEYEICNTEKSKAGKYKWDELILNVYSQIAELQKLKRLNK